MRPAKAKGGARALKPVDDRKVGKRKAAAPASRGKAKQTKKAKKDPNKPKRAPSAFFVFLSEFRQEFKRDNPDVKGVAAVGKAGGEKWRSMSDAEKAPYEAKSAKAKTEYEKQMKIYDKQSATEDGDEESEVHDEDDEASGEEAQPKAEEPEEEEVDDGEEEEDDD